MQMRFNAFADARELNGAGRVLVLTPHPGEMARLAGLSIKEVEADRIGLAAWPLSINSLSFSRAGALSSRIPTAASRSTSGNPARWPRKGGSGDILTGIVAAMLAQYARSGEASDVARAVEAAVYLHGLAADFAALDRDEHTILATGHHRPSLRCLPLSRAGY